MSVPNFIEVLEIAQRKEKFTPEVQGLAEGIDAATLATAVQITLAAKDTEAIDNAAFTDALKAGFEFAVKAVLMLKSAPGNTEKTNLYVNFKIARGEKLEKPGMFDMVKKHLFNAWEKVNHITVQRAQAEYIKQVNDLIASLGTQ